MQFKASEDIEVPIDFVFEQLSDFERFERTALRRGADVVRTDALKQPGVGMGWQAQFVFRGKAREMRGSLSEYDPPNRLKFDARVGGLEVVMAIDLVALSRARTRVMVVSDLKPHNIPARLLYQSIKLVKTNMMRRMNTRLADYAEELEDRYARIA
ncbi:SRPBCC family protein [Cognatishimia sp. MH4019]|uniref:SRPBCC family protein n=1 Tax=Cognatishimia sp. MH4019 TaxID=2854030 RepID=UPI001CD443E1|nr:SRPBCC family protein [Cognatishimia sp. MH4019]